MRYFGLPSACALVLAGCVSAEAVASVPKSSHPERVLRAATKRSDLHRRSTRIEQKFESEVVYIEEENGWGGKKTFASQVKVGSMKPILNLEEIEHHLQGVQCSDGMMRLHFADASTARDAKAACHGGHGGMGGLIITSHDGCNREGERSVYKIDDTSFSRDGATLELAVTESLWQDAFDRFDITFGHTTSDHLYRRHANFQKRQDESALAIPADTPDDVKSVTFDLAWETLDTTFEAADFLAGLENFVGVPNLPVEIGCKNCSTKGQMVLSQGAIKIDAKQIDLVPDFLEGGDDGKGIGKVVSGGYMELAAKGMGAHLEMFTRSAQSGSYQVALFPLPILGFVIPGIGKAGASFEPTIMVDFNISKPLEVTYGADIMIPEDASIKIELGNIAETSITGIPGAQLNALPFKTNVSDADILLSLAFMPSIPIGFEFSDKMSALITVSMNLPRLDAKMTTSGNTQCGLLSGPPPKNNTDTPTIDGGNKNNTDTTYDGGDKDKDKDTTYDGGNKDKDTYDNGENSYNDGGENSYNDGGENSYNNGGENSYNNGGENSYNNGGGNSYDKGYGNDGYGGKSYRRSDGSASGSLVLVEANVSVSVDVAFDISFPLLPAPFDTAATSAIIFSTEVPLMTSCVAPHDGSVVITQIAAPPVSTQSVCSSSSGTCDCAPATVTVYIPPTGGASPPTTTGHVEQPPSPPATTGYGEQPPATEYPEQPPSPPKTEQPPSPPSSTSQGEQPPATTGYGDQPPATTGYGDQPPSNPPKTEQPNNPPKTEQSPSPPSSTNHGEQPPATTGYGEQPPATTGYGDQPPATEYPPEQPNSPPSSTGYGEQPPATNYPEQPPNPPKTEQSNSPPSSTNHGEQPPATTGYGEQPPATTGYGDQPPATEYPPEQPNSPPSSTGYGEQPPATEYPVDTPHTSAGEQPPATTIAMTPYYPDAPPVETPISEPPHEQPPPSSTSCVSDSTIRITILPGGPPATTETTAQPTPPTESDGYGPPATETDGYGPPATETEGYGPPATTGTSAQPTPPTESGGYGTPPTESGGYGAPPTESGGYGAPPTNQSSSIYTKHSTMGTVVKSSSIILTETPTTSVSESTATPTGPTQVTESKGFMNTSSSTSPPTKSTSPPEFTGAAAPGAALPGFGWTQFGWQAGVLGMSVMFGSLMV